MEISRKGNIVLTRIQPANIIGIVLATGYTGTCYWYTGTWYRVHWNVLLGTLERATGYTGTCYWVHWNGWNQHKRIHSMIILDWSVHGSIYRD